MSYGIAGVLCCMMLYQDINYFETVDSDVIYNDDVGTLSYSVGHAEYLPVVTNMDNMAKEAEKDEAVQIDDIKKKYLTYDITAVNTANQEQKILLPVLYYSGTFHMTFHEPWYWRVSEIISFMTMFFMVYYIVKGKELYSVWKLKKLQTKDSENTAG